MDLPTAEREKRAIGLAGAGAGEGEMNAFVASVGRGFLSPRAQSRHAGDTSFDRYGKRRALIGIGRPHQTRRRLFGGCGLTHLGIERTAYPRDLARASAPDWALSVGLALWNVEEAAA